jgi:hypothetical protein
MELRDRQAPTGFRDDPIQRAQFSSAGVGAWYRAGARGGAEGKHPDHSDAEAKFGNFDRRLRGATQFAPIPGTSIEYAVNTADQVLKIGGKYYTCYQGAWFVSSAPTGPWVLADSVPPEIRTIPPSSPLYNVSYVQVYGATPTTVTYGYTAGYLMGFVTAGVLVYGTGYYYPPVVLPGPLPIYYPYPYSYAGSVWYNSATGAWARGGSVYGPYYGAAAGRYYNPTTGGWAQGAAVYGPYGGAGAWSAYNARTGTYSHGSAVWGGGSGTANASFYNPRYGVSGSTTQNVNPYGRWGSSNVSGPNKTVNTASASNARGSVGGFSSSTGAAGAGYHNRATGNSGGAVKGANGDVYAGRDGNVYRHTDDGWSKWNNGSSPLRTRPAGDRVRRAVGMAAHRAVGSAGSTAAATANWNRTASGGSSARDASAVAVDSGDKLPSGQSEGSSTVQRMIVSVTASALIALAGPAFAQQPTQAQTNAIRQACRADYQTYCSSVPTGGPAALSCLHQNAASLSPGCQRALGTVSHGTAAAGTAVPPAAAPAPGATPAPPLTRQQELSLTRRACQHDYRLFCSGVRPGAGRVVGCLRDNAQSLSPSCRSALLAARQAH